MIDVYMVRKCTRCDDLGYICKPVTHPTNPMLDTWQEVICICQMWGVERWESDD